jgi:hypothetical protein
MEPCIALHRNHTAVVRKARERTFSPAESEEEEFAMTTTRFAVAGVAAAALIAAGALAKPSAALTTLTANETGPLPEARGRLDVKHFPAKGPKEDREWLRLRANKLGKKAEVHLLCDDPATTEDASLVEFAVFSTRGNGNINFRLDTRKDDLPHGATLTDLAGLPFEVRDADGVVLLFGTIPALPPEEEEEVTE